MSRHHYFAYGVLVGAVIVLGLLLVLQQPYREAFAQTANSNNRMIAATGQIENGIDALFLVDTDPSNPRLLVYEARNGRTLKLIGVRDIQWDMKMLDWVNAGGRGAKGDPSVHELKKEYEKQEKKQG
jgi:hypothetical protein